MSAITPAIRPAIGPAIRSAFDGGFAPSLLSQAMALVRKYGGALYDPSNRASLFQDSAGTIPVTAAGQPVGLMLDMSYGLQRGAELIVNGDFSAGSTGWDLLSGAAVASSGLSLSGALASATSAGTVCTAGKWYQVEFDFLSGAGSQYINVYAGGPAFGVVVDTTPRRYKLIKLAVTNEAFRVQQDGGASGSAVLDNISCKEIPGNHAFQATTTARPTYQLVDGYPAIVGDGVDDFLLIPTLETLMDGVNPWWGATGLRRRTGDANWGGVLGKDQVASPLTRSVFGMLGISARAQTSRFLAGAGVEAVVSAGVPFDTRVVYSGGFSGTQSTGRVNLMGYVSVADARSIGAGTAAPFKLFYRQQGSDIFALVVVGGTPTTVEQAVIARFAASRSGVVL